jgi:hypothetical protein
MRLDAITLLFKEAFDVFPPIKGKPTNDDLLAIREVLLPILMVIPFDLFRGVHSLTALLTDDTKYTANHSGKMFVCPKRLPLYDDTIANDASTVVHVHAEAAHKSCLKDYDSYNAAKCGCAKFLRNVVNEVWYNNLKDADTFYTKVTALEIMAFLDLNSGGLHAVGMISLCTNMHQYYTQADGIPQYFIMLEDAQKKAQRAGMPIADIELVMMASAAVLTTQHFTHKVDDWEGLPAVARTWMAWKTAFCLAHLKRQCQISASGGGEPLGGAHGVTPALPPAMDRLESALDNLALAATINIAVLQQLAAANLALTSPIVMLTATNKKLVDTAVKTPSRGSATPASSSKSSRSTKNPFPGNYCWTHGHCCSEQHTSATCGNKAPGHKDGATSSNMMGGSKKDKGWDKPRA